MQPLQPLLSPDLEQPLLSGQQHGVAPWLQLPQTWSSLLKNRGSVCFGPCCLGQTGPVAVDTAALGAQALLIGAGLEPAPMIRQGSLVPLLCTMFVLNGRFERQPVLMVL